MSFWHQLYHHQTKQEQKAECVIATLNTRYRTQHPFRCGAKSYFADFWLPDYRIVVEIDDVSHNRADKRKKDLERSEALQALGLLVIRVTNQEVDSPDGLQSLKDQLITQMGQRPAYRWEPALPTPVQQSIDAFRQPTPSPRRRGRAGN